jgi:ATP-dependent protease ClpP protease subunit
VTIAPVRPDWYRIEAKADGVTDIHIFDEIGESFWGGGVSSSAFVEQLNAVATPQINLHINSVGGNFFDGVAIMNSLRDHDAKVVVHVDGLAASAASVIAMAGDEIVMNLGSQMMIHEAHGGAHGPAETMQEMVSALNSSSESMASIYAERAGGTPAEWRTAMKAETWYTAQEAVDAGLADRVDKAAKAEDIAARFDLSIFAHAGRAAAPKPYMPPRPHTPVSAVEAARRIHNAPVKGSITHQEGSDMSETFAQGMRERLGLPAGASETEVFAALDALRASTTPPEPTPTPEPTPDPAPEPEPTPPAAPKVAGTMTIDASAWEAQQETIKRHEAAFAKHAREERDQVIAQAIKDGKFAPARKDHWARLWDADPEGTRAVIDTLTKNVIPVEAKGFGVEDDEAYDAEHQALWGPTKKAGV